MTRTDRTPKKTWQDKFFDAFEDTHIVRSAAKAAGVARSTVYKHREQDPEFAARWAESEEHSTQVLEQIVVKRAKEGSDTLAIFLLKARRPNVYREHHVVEHAGSVQHRVKLDLRKLTDEQLRALEAIQPEGSE